jgi:hypothetical protein
MSLNWTRLRISHSLLQYHRAKFIDSMKFQAARKNRNTLKLMLGRR